MPPFRLQRPDPSEYNPRFHSEITSVPDADDFASLIRDQARATVEFMNTEFGENHASVRYGPDKWTAREVIGHLSDCERVFGYRAMRIARGDLTVLPGFDENAYVPAGQFERRTLASVLDEFLGVRAATIGLVEGLTDEFAARSAIWGAARCRCARFCTSPPDTSCIICACSARDTFRPSATDAIAR